MFIKIVVCQLSHADYESHAIRIQLIVAIDYLTNENNTEIDSADFHYALSYLKILDHLINKEVGVNNHVLIKKGNVVVAK